MSADREGKSQIDKFREAARELGTDDDEKRFDATLGRIARAQLPKDEKAERPKTPRRSD